MARSVQGILQVAEAALAEQNAELVAAMQCEQQAVTAQAATGSANIDAAFQLDVRFRLVFVRCHFTGTGPAGPMTISLDSALGAAYDARLFTILRAGPGRDVHLRIPADQSIDPSPWTFQAGDAVRIAWTNPSPGVIGWGLEVGLAIAA